MLQAFTTLLGLHLLGEILVRALHLPVPGPVVGMLALVVLLLRRGGPPAWLEPTAQGLLRHLGLLFVPAGVGIIVHTDLLTRAWLPLLLTLLLGTTRAGSAAHVTRVPQLGQNIAVPGIWKPQTPHCFTAGALVGGGP